MPAAYHAPRKPMKQTDTEEDRWHNVELNSHLSVDAWKRKLDVERSKKDKSDASGVRVKGMKWAVSALRV